MLSPNPEGMAQSGLVPTDKSAAAGNINAMTCALSREAMCELGDLLGSLGTSIAEAAFRDSPSLCRLHLIEGRAVLKSAIDVLKGWESSLPQGEGPT